LSTFITERFFITNLTPVTARFTDVFNVLTNFLLGEEVSLRTRCFASSCFRNKNRSFVTHLTFIFIWCYTTDLTVVTTRYAKVFAGRFISIGRAGLVASFFLRIEKVESGFVIPDKGSFTAFAFIWISTEAGLTHWIAILASKTLLVFKCTSWAFIDTNTIREETVSRASHTVI